MGNYSNCGFYSCCCCCCRCSAGDFDKTATRRDEKKFTIYSVGLLVVAHASACNLSFGKQQPPPSSSSSSSAPSSAVRCPGLSGLEGFIASTVPFERACMRTDRSMRAQPQYVRACVCFSCTVSYCCRLITHWNACDSLVCIDGAMIDAYYSNETTS